MIDKTKNEAQAIEYAALVAGEIIGEQIANGVGSDLSRWSRDAYLAFVESAISAFVERLQELKSNEEAAS